MTRNASKHPTELELEILKVLWEAGPSTVREVRELLEPVRDLAYTSVMTVMNIMTKKGYLKRRKNGNSFVYRASVNRDATANRMLGDVVDRLFEGSRAMAALQLLETSDIDEAELARLRALLLRDDEEVES